MTSDRQGEINRLVYHASGVDRQYASRLLSRIETLALLAYQPAFAGKEVLDVGVGTGRTTAYLAPLARRYVGVDYSPVMIGSFRATYPGLASHLGDLTDLSFAADGTFAFVFGPSNVLDAVSHDDRLRALREFRRVLQPAGILMFSSHNLSFRGAGNGPRLELNAGPCTQIVNLWRWVRRLVNHWSVRGQRRREPDYALFNDLGHDFACLHYYVDPGTQRAQLAREGFEVLEVLDEEGRVVPDGGTASDSTSLMYVAKRAS